MLGIKDLEKTLGLTTDQVRFRVGHLRDHFDDVVQQGQRGKLLVTDKGITFLQQLRDLEAQGHSLQSATTVILESIENTDQKSETSVPNLSQSDALLIQTLQETVSLLKAQMDIKDIEIGRLHDLLNRQLPPESEGRKSRWQYLKSVVTGH